MRRLADSVVTELELAALVDEYENDRLRWGLAIDAAGIGTFDWDLVTGKLTWDDQLNRMFGYDAESFGPHQADWFIRLRREQGNVRAALEFCLSNRSEAAVTTVIPVVNMPTLSRNSRLVGSLGTALLGGDVAPS